MRTLTEISSETYGHDGRAINKHHDRRFQDGKGRLYVLSKTMDGCPPFFEAYGPFKKDYVGLLPRLKVNGKEYWGDGWSWTKALKAFYRELCAKTGKRNKDMKIMIIIIVVSSLFSLTAMADDEEFSSVIMPTGDGRGIAACVSVSFGDFTELPEKAAKGLWRLVVSITQPVHPYHYVRNGGGRIVKDSNGNSKKVWLPFYRLWGKHQGDSVVGIIYDNRGTNGIAGSHLFAGYGRSGWQDKSGKAAGLALLAWGMSKNLEGRHSRREHSVPVIEPAPIVSTRHSNDESNEITPQQQETIGNQPQPEPPGPLPELEGEWGEGGPVGM